MIYNLLLSAGEYRNEGKVNWIYSENQVGKDPDGNPKFKDFTMQFQNGIIKVNDKQWDLLFFIMKKSQQYKTGEFLLIDREKDADDLAQSRMLKTDFSNILWGSRSPLTGYDLRNIARAYKISESSTLTENMLKVRLETEIENIAKKDTSIYSRFINDVENIEGVTARAIVFRAIEENVIYIDYSRHTAGFKVKSTENPVSFFNFNTNEFGSEIEALAEWLETIGSDTMATIKASLGILSDNWKTLKEKDLQAYKKGVYDYAKKHGIPRQPRSFEAIEGDVIKHLEKNEVPVS